MPDVNENMIDDKVDKIIVGILGAVGGILGITMAALKGADMSIPWWLPLIGGAVPAVMSYFSLVKKNKVEKDKPSE